MGMNGMKLAAGILTAMLLITCRPESAPSLMDQGAPRARADLIDGQGKTVATALLIEESKGVSITLDVLDLPPGVHAFHIHAAGRCDLPDFESAGGHFNPFAKKHGMKNPEGPHAGDLPNILVPPSGKAEVRVLAPLVTLGKGKNSLFPPEGTCLVIHAQPDDEVTDPTGNAGARLACGVIKRE